MTTPAETIQKTTADNALNESIENDVESGSRLCSSVSAMMAKALSATATGACSGRNGWNLIHVAMLLFPEFMRLAFCLKDSSRLAAPLWRGECEDLRLSSTCVAMDF